MVTTVTNWPVGKAGNPGNDRVRRRFWNRLPKGSILSLILGGAAVKLFTAATTGLFSVPASAAEGDRAQQRSSSAHDRQFSLPATSRPQPVSEPPYSVRPQRSCGRTFSD